MSGFRPYSDEEAAANAAAAPPDAERLLHGPRERTRRLYRVTGVWSDRTDVRHYQTKKAAEHRAAVFREGRKALETYDHMNGPTEVVGPITPALTVTVEASDPITWPTP